MHFNHPLLPFEMLSSADASSECLLTQLIPSSMIRNLSRAMQQSATASNKTQFLLLQPSKTCTCSSGQQKPTRKVLNPEKHYVQHAGSEVSRGDEDRNPSEKKTNSRERLIKLLNHRMIYLCELFSCLY